MAQAVQALALTPQSAVERIREAFPDEAKLLDEVVKKNIIALATDEAFALRDQNGEIRAFKQSLTLSAKAGTLIQPVPGGPWALSAQGYEVWSEDAGACVIFPSEVLVNNQWMANPAVIRDDRNGRILMIYARAVAFRFSSKGIPMVSDWTTIYDTPSYRMVDLLAKAKKKPQAFKLLPIDMTPAENTGEGEKKGTWAKYPFDEATALWMNTSHEEALEWLGQIINREKKAIDFAQTFAKRNALKHLSGLQKAPILPTTPAAQAVWTIPVISWRPTNGNIIKWDSTQYAALQARVGNLINGDRKEFAAIELQTGKENTSDDPATAGLLEEELDSEDHALEAQLGGGESAEPQPGTQDQAQEPTAEDKRVLANLAVTKESFPDEYEQALVNLKLTQDPQDIKTATAIITEINRILDSGNE